jgi:outer membrane protein assembly factor BamD (BamD/ComL family)
MEMFREAVPFLKEFVASFPNHPLASKAKQKLRECEKAIETKPRKGKGK